MKLKQTWRWFGPADTVSLQYIKQTGASGIVTALHHIPHGEIWSLPEILERKALIESHQLSWDVVESLTVHESIKTASGDYMAYIEKYKQSMQNLAEAGITIITYNFMPILDWTRTAINHPMPDGSRALYFDWTDLAIFDIFLLQRDGARASYPENIVAEAEQRYKTYQPVQLDTIAEAVMFGIPGEKKLTIDELRTYLKTYATIGHDGLRQNLKFFLEQVAPLADELGIKLAIHPDDPPFDIMGLPRIVSNQDDIAYILDAVDIPANGICFCTGSLGAGKHNNLPAIARMAGQRINFIHLRNVTKDTVGNFYEADHLDGDVDMYLVMKELLSIQQNVAEPVPFRPDHGHQMMDDLDKTTAPGYSAIGRMRGLAELRGLEMAICRNNGW